MAGLTAVFETGFQNGLEVDVRGSSGDKEGSHATPSEISLAAYAYPEAVKTAPLPPVAKAAGGFTGAADFRRRYPDGRMGSDPSGASAAHGKRLYETAVKALAADYRGFVAAD